MKFAIRLLAFVTALTSASAAAANNFQPLTDEAQFLQLLDGKRLSNRLYGINLVVYPSGTIGGTAAGWDVTGTWAWQNGFFCREMNWGGDTIPYNCQLVEVRNNNEMRFTVDQGSGDSASFMLR